MRHPKHLGPSRQDVFDGLQETMEAASVADEEFFREITMIQCFEEDMCGVCASLSVPDALDDIAEDYDGDDDEYFEPCGNPACPACN